MSRGLRLGVALVVIASAVGLSGCGGGGTVPAPATTPVAEPLTSSRPAPEGALTFAGWHWHVKERSTPVGPGPNRFGGVDAGNVAVDGAGRLHLRIRQAPDGEWTAAEVFATESMGYGTYTWTLEPPAVPEEPHAVLGLFTWSDVAEQHHREIDIELSQFRRPESAITGQMVVQPHATPGNLTQFSLLAKAPTPVRFTWRPGEVAFEVPGADPREWVYRGPDVPRPGGAVHPRMNLWLLAGDAPFYGNEVEVIVRDFSYVPIV